MIGVKKYIEVRQKSLPVVKIVRDNVAGTEVKRMKKEIMLNGERYVRLYMLPIFGELPGGHKAITLNGKRYVREDEKTWRDAIIEALDNDPKDYTFNEEENHLRIYLDIDEDDPTCFMPYGYQTERLCKALAKFGGYFWITVADDVIKFEIPDRWSRETPSYEEFKEIFFEGY